MESLHQDLYPVSGHISLMAKYAIVYRVFRRTYARREQNET